MYSATLTSPTLGNALLVVRQRSFDAAVVLRTGKSDLAYFVTFGGQFAKPPGISFVSAVAHHFASEHAACGPGEADSAEVTDLRIPRKPF
jgi:hypothetical protein